MTNEIYPDIDLSQYVDDTSEQDTTTYPIAPQTEPQTRITIYEYERNGVGGVIEQPKPYFVTDTVIVTPDGDVVATKEGNDYVSRDFFGVTVWTWKPDYSVPGGITYSGALKLERVRK